MAHEGAELNVLLAKERLKEAKWWSEKHTAEEESDRLANIEVTIIEQTELAKREFIDE
jgi:hypothetical protein